MLDRRKLAGDAAYMALSLRKRLRIPMDFAIAPIDAAEALGVDVRLVDMPSMEGIYVAADQPSILLSSLRPQGRRNFTCAHEIGHHVLGHGQQFDELVDQRSARRVVDPIEFSADSFASYFLMPKVAVDSGMSRRSFQYSSLTRLQAYALASWLGVGYASLVHHLYYGLRVIGKSQASELLKSTPKTIRAELLGHAEPSSLHVVDQSWTGRAIDCEVGDYLLLPSATLCEGNIFDVARRASPQLLVAVQSQGIGRVSGSRPYWSAFVRSSRKQYVGRSRYRFEEEVEE